MGYLLGLVLLGGCSLHPSNNDSGGAINLAASPEFVFVARGTAGLDVVRADSTALVFSMAPQGNADSVDDVAFAVGHLFLLDADDGVLSSYAVNEDGSLALVTADREVEVGPYSGVTANETSVVVSGGTCSVSIFELDPATPGELGGSSSVDPYRGVPDATAAPGRPQVVLSTHFSGDADEFVDDSEFGIAVLHTERAEIVDAAGIIDAGFTDGGGTPASWPVRVEVRGDRVLVAHGGGLSRFSIDADGSLASLDQLTLDGPATDVSTFEDKAYVVSANATLSVVDLSDDVMQVEQSTSLPMGAQPTAVIALGPWVFIAGGEQGLVTVAR